MPRQSIADMKFTDVYPLLVRKAERKGRTREEVDAVIRWLTGYEDLPCDSTYGEFIENAPLWNPHAEQITGTICGIRVESIEDPLMKKIRQLDKLIDELAKGKPIGKIMR